MLVVQVLSCSEFLELGAAMVESVVMEPAGAPSAVLSAASSSAGACAAAVLLSAVCPASVSAYAAVLTAASSTVTVADTEGACRCSWSSAFSRCRSW